MESQKIYKNYCAINKEKKEFIIKLQQAGERQAGQNTNEKDTLVKENDAHEEYEVQPVASCSTNSDHELNLNSSLPAYNDEPDNSEVMSEDLEYSYESCETDVLDETEKNCSSSEKETASIQVKGVNEEKEDIIGDAALSNRLVNWYNTHNASLASFKEILQIFRASGHPQLPSDPRTLLKTKTAELTNVGEGLFTYFGIENGIRSNLVLDDLNIKTLYLNFNIDGIPIYKSVGTSFWPILCSMSKSLFVTSNSPVKPFIVAIYCGKTKPEINAYLNEFSVELEKLMNEGLCISEKHINVVHRAMIADAPAKAFVKQVKSHGGYYACDRCNVRGEFNTIKRSMSYVDIEVEKRTD